MQGPLIVTAELGAQDQSWLDALRQRHFPPEHNRLRAHLTMFHTLPPSVEGEIRRYLAALTARPKPAAMLAAPYVMGGGMAFRIDSPDLEVLREEIADHFHGSLTAQDSRGWRPHVTIQNKVTPALAHDTLAEVAAGFRPRSIEISGLGLHRYDGGPWQTLRRFSFRG